eukprot:455958-Pleurochrysis_carterae.AAC.1
MRPARNGLKAGLPPLRGNATAAAALAPHLQNRVNANADAIAMQGTAGCIRWRYQVSKYVACAWGSH